MYVEPGQRVYVRRVVFQGNTRTEDGVLRREMRQLEGSWYSQAAIDRSKVRLQRLGYFKTVEIDKKLVAGTQDKVDVSVKVEEQSAGSMQFGIGYSQYSGIILNASVSQNNLFGSGDSFSISGERSSYYTRLGLNYYNPYLTDSGIGIGYSASYSKTDYGNTDFANYATSAKSFSSYLGIPISETDGIRVGLGVSSNKVNLFAGYSPQILVDYQNQIGNKTIHTWTGTLGWNHDTRNGYWAPTRGGLLSASTDIALPGSTVQYWKLTTEANHYWPIGKGFVLYLDGQVGYGKTYGRNGISDEAFESLKTASLAANPNHVLTDMRQDLPFWQNYYAGGVRDVRGFQDNTLGPRVCIDGSLARHQGHVQQRRLLLAADRRRVQGARDRPSLPAAAVPEGRQHRPRVLVHGRRQRLQGLQELRCKELRASTGLSLQWQAPIGPLIISLAMPFRSKDADRHYEERIQFTFGSQF